MPQRSRGAKAEFEAKRIVARRARKTDDPEVSALNGRLAQAWEQQKAIDEILRVMSSSPGDVQPVLDAVAERTARLCESPFARVLLVDGDVARAVAAYSLDGTPQARTSPLPLKRSTIIGRAVLDRMTIHHDDVVPLLESEYPDAVNARRLGLRAVLAVPLMREGNAYGVILLFRREPRAFSPDQVALVETFARQAAIAIENARLFNETKEALEQQTAISEILRVISSSPTDVQPVFDTIGDSAMKLCAAELSVVSRVEGREIRLAAVCGTSAEGTNAVVAAHPYSIDAETLSGRTIRTRKVQHLPDVFADPLYARKEVAKIAGWRAGLGVPMLREGNVIGAIFVGRRDPGRFSHSQIALLKTFADQAAIAIQNVRLFNETKEALEQQTATSEILRVISQSPRDVQPVFDTIAAAALELCSASSATVFRFDGELIRIAALVNASPEGADAVRRFYPKPPGRDNAASRAVLTCSVVTIPDVLEDRDIAYGDTALASSFRSVLSVPLIRDRKPIGAISVGKREPGPFPAKQIALLQTFADQAVIAIENVRLFTELTHKNHALTQAHAQVSEALERQTATSEVLRVISGSPTDVQPVFETIVASAARLCSAESAAVYRFDGEVVHFVAGHHFTPEAFEAYGRRFPRPLRETDHLQRVVGGSVINIPDFENDPHTTSRSGDHFRARDVRSMVFVPMVREGQAIGAIGVFHRDIGAFSDDRVALLKTFADQAVIAIENVRLFNETNEALAREIATADILRAISSSPTDVQPVFDTIVATAKRLMKGYSSLVTVRRDDALHLAALSATTKAGDDALRHRFPVSLDSSSSRILVNAVRSGLPAMRIDTEADADVSPQEREMARTRGYRSALGVPIMRAGEAIGTISVTRTDPGSFSTREIELLQTFASQAVIAIENVRLFNETKEALERQTATSEILRVISQSPRDVQPVFDAIVAAALRLCDAASANLFTYNGELLHLGAYAREHTAPDPAGDLRGLRTNFPRPAGRDLAGPRAVLTCSVVSIPDVLSDDEYAFKEFAVAGGFRSVLAVPLVRNGTPIGALVVGRSDPGHFPDKQVALLRTFADQAVIAIENVRLFKELETRTADLTRSVQELRALGEIGQAVSSTLDLETVLSTIVSRATTLAGMDAGAIYEYDEAAKSSTCTWRTAWKMKWSRHCARGRSGRARARSDGWRWPASRRRFATS